VQNAVWFHGFMVYGFMVYGLRFHGLMIEIVSWFQYLNDCMVYGLMIEWFDDFTHMWPTPTTGSVRSCGLPGSIFPLHAVGICPPVIVSLPLGSCFFGFFIGSNARPEPLPEAGAQRTL
jgi:hypothetical protein